MGGAAAALLSHSVQQFTMDNACIGDAGAAELAAALPRTSVHSLDLSSNAIGAAGAEKLAEALPYSSILHLNLGGTLCFLIDDSDGLGITGVNNIEDAGTQALAAALPKSKVTHLDLDTNSITVDGAKALAAALPRSEVVQLDLNNNKVGGPGAQALAAALPNSNIQTLVLANNNIGDAGAGAVAGVLPRTRLLQLDLCSNSLSDESGAALEHALWKTPTIMKEFGFEYNLFSVKVQVGLENARDHNMPGLTKRRLEALERQKCNMCEVSCDVKVLRSFLLFWRRHSWQECARVSHVSATSNGRTSSCQELAAIPTFYQCSRNCDRKGEYRARLRLIEQRCES